MDAKRRATVNGKWQVSQWFDWMDFTQSLLVTLAYNTTFAKRINDTPCITNNNVGLLLN